MLTADAKAECDALADRQYTDMTLDQVKDKRPKAKDLPHTIQGDELDYE
jgi:hypothetical protein